MEFIRIHKCFVMGYRGSVDPSVKSSQAAIDLSPGLLPFSRRPRQASLAQLHRSDIKTGASICFEEPRQYAAPTELAVGFGTDSYKDFAPSELCQGGWLGR